jgi:hypothetical protein
VLLIPPDEHERLLILGKNGTGKSELTFALEAAGKYHVIYFDWKGDCNPHRLDAAGQPFVIVKRGDDTWGFRNRRVVYRPPRGSAWRTDAACAAVLRRLIAQAERDYNPKTKRSRRPRLIVIPEILLFGPLAQAVMAEIASGARAFELGLWIETQRPRRIPVVIRSEAWRLYVFPLGYADDELEVLKYAKGRLQLEQLRELDRASEEKPARHPFIEIVLRSKQGGAIRVTLCPELELAA